MTQVVFRMPEPYPALARAMDDASRDAVVLAAPCSRARLAFLAWLLARTTGSGRRSVWLTANPAADMDRVREWLGVGSGEPRWWAEIRRGFELGGGEVLVLPHPSSGGDYEQLPVHACSDLVVADAHAAADPSAWVAQNVTGLTRYVGAFPQEGHWLRRLEQAAPSTGLPVHRITADDALAGGAVTADRLGRIRAALPESRYEREYAGRYTSADLGGALRFNTFARTRLWIRTKEGQVVPFRLRSVQRTYLALKMQGRRELAARGLPPRFLLLKYRRGGFTTHEQGESYQLTSGRENMQAVTLAHTAKATAQIFRIAQLYHRRDPKAPRLKGVGNAKQLEFADLNSVFSVGTAGGTGEGRGDTFQRVHGSEVSKWGKGPRRREQVDDLVVGLSEAASHGEVVLETTANGIEWFAETYRAAKARQNDWWVVFLPWFFDPTYRMPEGTYSREEIRDTLEEDERFLVEQHRLTLAQIAWRRQKKRAIRGLFRQEYPENDSDCFLTVGLCYFDVGAVLDLSEVLEPYETEEVPSGIEATWEEAVPGEEYVAGVDTSEGVPGSDPNGIGVLKRRTGEQVYSIHGVFTPAELAWHCRRVSKLYNDALVGVERNNHGHAVISNLEGEPFLYYADDGRAGWVTSPKTRPVMLSDLKEAVEEGHMLVRDRQLLEECLLFVKQRNGKYEGKPDDSVMKWAIAWQMRQYAPPRSDYIPLRSGGAQ